MTAPDDPRVVRPALSVCIVTYERADYLARCLRSLAEHVSRAAEIVVVDASAQSAKRDALLAHPDVVYLHRPDLAGWMTRSRNEGLHRVTGQIIAFLDDDVVVSAGWERALLAAFEDPEVAAAAGRTRNGFAGEEVASGPIGALNDDGTLTADFAADVPDVVDVTHGIGANMAFRRRTLAELGGLRDDYPGTAMREDTDIFLRVRKLGQRAVFVPRATVDHRPAPHVKGRRFDTRYKLYGRRNHMVLLARDGGIRSTRLRRWVASDIRRVAAPPDVRGRVRRLGVTAIGLAWGAAAMVRQARWNPLPPQRTDPAARWLRAWLET